MYFKVFSKKTGKCVSDVPNVQTVDLSESEFHKGWIRYLVWYKHEEEPKTIHINPKTFRVQFDEGGMI